MEQWFIRPDGMVDSPSGRTLPIEKIQDQIDDGRIEVVEKPKPRFIDKVLDVLNKPIF